MPEQALSHLKVLELCNMVCGPYCTKLLADLGAEVIKIESPKTGDVSRRWDPFLNDIPHPERSGLFLYLNTNKLGITLDVRSSTGKRIFKELIEQIDIIVEDNPPAVMEEIGLTYEELKKINPGLVMTSITPFGQIGPYRDYRSHGLNSFHAGGEGFLLPIQSPDLSREPLKSSGLVGDCVCGLSASLATLAAVYRMKQTGLGQHLDVSKQDMLMAMIQLDIAMFANMGVVRDRLMRPLLMPIPMKCQDGYIQISALTDREWRDVVDFMGNPRWAEDERYSQWLSRHLHGNEITPRVEEFVGQYQKDDLSSQLQAKAIAAVPVNTPENLANSSQMKAREFFAEIDHPETGKLKYPTASYKLSKTPWRAERAAPTLGQHNETIFCDRLGYTKHDLVTLREQGSI